MSTEAQIKANRKNAQKSTGPRTEEGKEAASQNATKHGFCSCKNVIRSESQDEYNLFHDEMIADLSPAGAMEEMLVERIISLSWRLKRTEVYQNAVIESFMDFVLNADFRSYRSIQDQAKNGDMSLLLGMSIRNGFGNSKILEQLLVYEKRIESSLYKAAAELRKLQKMRRERETMDEGRRTMDEGREKLDDARQSRDEKDFAKRTQLTQENRIQDTENKKDAIRERERTDEERETMDEGKMTDNFAKQTQSAVTGQEILDSEDNRL